jgi:hypothetical protein
MEEKDEGVAGPEVEKENERFPRENIGASPVTDMRTKTCRGPRPKVGRLGVHGVPVSLHCQNQKRTVRCAVW